MRPRIKFSLKCLAVLLLFALMVGWCAGRVQGQPRMTGLEVVQKSREFSVWRFVDEKDRTCYIVQGRTETMVATSPIAISCVR